MANQYWESGEERTYLGSKRGLESSNQQSQLRQPFQTDSWLQRQRGHQHPRAQTDNNHHHNISTSIKTFSLFIYCTCSLLIFSFCRFFWRHTPNTKDKTARTARANIEDVVLMRAAADTKNEEIRSIDRRKIIQNQQDANRGKVGRKVHWARSREPKAGRNMVEITCDRRLSVTQSRTRHSTRTHLGEGSAGHKTGCQTRGGNDTRPKHRRGTNRDTT